jgi:hypothetical protein
MEVPYYNMAVEEYNTSMFEAHISKEFRDDSTDVLHLLVTKGTQVFVPSKWEGIKEIEPLELRWKPTLPSSIMKPRTRPLFNPNKLYQHAKKGFDRLMLYFYEPLASRLVVAPKATTPFIRFCS